MLAISNPPHAFGQSDFEITCAMIPELYSTRVITITYSQSDIQGNNKEKLTRLMNYEFCSLNIVYYIYHIHSCYSSSSMY